jgi:type IV pilus assembly protein PilV
MGAFSMLEILVSLLITMIGLLGIAALQSQLQVAQLEAYQRSQALILLADIGDRLGVNRSTMPCFNITSNTTTGVPYLGASGNDHYLNGTPAACAASTFQYNQLADLAIRGINASLLGSGESKGGSSVGAMIGARACISYDPTSELPASAGGTIANTGLWTIAVSWQGMSTTFTPPINCANGLYGSESQRRTVSTTLRFGGLAGS